MRSWLFLLLALLAGCASTPPPAGPESPWAERRARLQQLQAWQAEGKLALRNGEAAESANLLWRQAGDTANLQLSGPLGMAATRIHSDGKILEIQRAGEVQVLDISTPRAVRLNTGWDLPLASLPYWMKGIPHPSSDTDHINVEQDLLRSLEQGGWRVHYEQYGRFGDYTLPTRLWVEREDTRARLVIRQWLPGTRG